MSNSANDMLLDDAKLVSLQKRMDLAKYLIIAGVIFVGLAAGILIFGLVDRLGIPGYITIVLFLIGFALVFGGAILRQKVGESRKNIAANYARVILNTMMDRLDEFDQGKQVSKYYINQDFGYPKYDRVGYCGDYVKGVLRNVPMEMCEFELQEEHVTRDDEDGDVRTSHETVFYGIIVVCRHEFKLNGAVSVTQYTEYQDAVKTGKEIFDRLFSVKAEDAQDVPCVLSDDYMQKLLKLTEQKGKVFAIRFSKDGTFLFVIRDMNLFEASDITNTTELVEKMEKELDGFVDVYDVLTTPVKG